MFTSGQVSDGAVPYTNTNAVCGKTTNGDDPTQATNRTNLTLPAVQACASPIGPKWVAAVTNWFCYVIDAAGLTYAAGQVCQSPLLLLQAIQGLISTATQGLTISGVGGWLPSHPTNTIGKDGDFYLEKDTENLWGPKASGAWPAAPAFWGNNRVVGTTGNYTITRYNQFIVIGPGGGTNTFTLQLPTCIGHGNERFTIENGTSVDQNVVTFGSEVISGAPEWLVTTNVITLKEGQVVELVSTDESWTVVTNSITNIYYKETAASALIVLNAFIEIAASTTVVTTIAAGAFSENAGTTMKLYNSSSVNQTVISPLGGFIGRPQWSTMTNPITLTPGQIIELVSNGTDWVVFANNGA